VGLGELVGNYLGYIWGIQVKIIARDFTQGFLNAVGFLRCSFPMLTSVRCPASGNKWQKSLFT